MNTLARQKRFRFGMRTLKSALSVTISLTLAYLFHSSYPAFMAIGALGTMERSITASIKSARNLIIGNFFGAIIASLLSMCFDSWLPLIAGIGTILLLIFCNKLHIQSAANLACVVFVCLLVDIQGGASLLFGFSRFLDTVIGTLIALAVNIIIRPYNPKPHIYSLIRNDRNSMIPLLEQRVLRCRIPSLEDIDQAMIHLRTEVDIISQERYNSMLTKRDCAHIAGCHQLVCKMYDALACICSLDATPMPNDENLKRLYDLGLDKTDQDNFLDGKCTFEDRIVLNYYLKIFLDANDYLSELLEL